MDSELILGTTTVKQAPITGESIPVDKNTGDPLFAGTINGDSAIQCRVTKAAADSTLAVIIRKVEEAQSSRAKSDQFIEKFSRYYVPLVMISSIIVIVIPPLAIRGAWYPWVYKGLELLVISCPCSLVISTPVSIVAGLTAAARAGVHARCTVNIIIQNVVFSLAIKGLFVGLTFANKSTLWMAMLADMGGTFVLVSNALRLVSFQGKNKKAPKCPQIHYTSTVETLPMVSGTGKECKSGCTNYACKKSGTINQNEENRDAILSITATEGGVKAKQEEKVSTINK